MKKIIFKVNLGNLVAMIKDMNNINCRMQIDIEHGLVIVENVNNSLIDTVINLIDKYFKILSVVIETSSKEEPVTENATLDSIPIEKIPTDNTTSKLEIAPICYTEKVLLEELGPALAILDCSKKVEDQVDIFMTTIGMPTNEPLREAFIIACGLHKITYTSIILEMRDRYYPELSCSDILPKLKENFKKWFEQYPSLMEKCPKLSLTAVLKVFAKRFST